MAKDWFFRGFESRMVGKIDSRRLRKPGKVQVRQNRERKKRRT